MASRACARRLADQCRPLQFLLRAASRQLSASALRPDGAASSVPAAYAATVPAVLTKDPTKCTFATMLPSYLAGKLPGLGIVEPTPVQAACIPALLRAETDVLMQAVTGSGKTLAYVLPLLARVDNKSSTLQALVITPTRELAVQVSAIAERLGKGGSGQRKAHPVLVQRLVGLPNAAMAGALRDSPPHVVVATPALAAALVTARHLRLNSLRTLVLDEADALLAPSAAPHTLALLAAAAEAAAANTVSGPPEAPLRRVYVSATLTAAVRQAASEQAATGGSGGAAQCAAYSDSGDAAAEEPREMGEARLPAALRHWALITGIAPAVGAVGAEAAGAAQASWVARLHAALKPTGCIVVFVKDSAAAAPMLAALRARKFRAAALTAELPRERKERAMVLRRARAGTLQVLVASEMGSRGLDLPNVELVVNAEPPPDSRAYLHRAGRASRLAPGLAAAPPGLVVTLVAGPQEALAVKATAGALGAELAVGEMRLGELVEQGVGSAAKVQG